MSHSCHPFPKGICRPQISQCRPGRPALVLGGILQEPPPHSLLPFRLSPDTPAFPISTRPLVTHLLSKELLKACRRGKTLWELDHLFPRASCVALGKSLDCFLPSFGPVRRGNQVFLGFTKILIPFPAFPESSPITSWGQERATDFCLGRWSCPEAGPGLPSLWVPLGSQGISEPSARPRRSRRRRRRRKEGRKQGQSHSRVFRSGGVCGPPGTPTSPEDPGPSKIAGAQRVPPRNAPGPPLNPPWPEVTSSTYPGAKGRTQGLGCFRGGKKGREAPHAEKPFVPFPRAHMVYAVLITIVF